MVATLSLRVCTGSTATTVSDPVSGLAFLSTDSPSSDFTTRMTYPVVVGTSSYEKHLRLKVDAPPNVSVSNFRFWTDGSPAPNVALKFRSVGTGGASAAGDATPVATAMTGGDAYAYTASSPYTGWDTNSYSATNSYTRALVLQLQPSVSATPGTWPQEVLYLSYDES